MDDIYFSDRNSRNKNKRPASHDRFTDETPIAPPSRLTDENRADPKFVVQIPDSEPSPRSPERRPKGRPVSSPAPQSRPSQAGQARSRTPSGARVTDQRNRTPSGARVPSPDLTQAQSAEKSRQASPSVSSKTEKLPVPEYVPHEESSLVTSSSVAPKDVVQAQGTPQRVQDVYSSKTRGTKSPNGNGGGKKSKKGKGKKGAKIAVAVLCVLLVLFGGVFAYGYSLLGKISYDTKTVDKNEYISEKELATSKDVRNILFFGSDARGEISGQRSDTMMLFSIDQKNKMIKLTSFLRDSYVCIPSSGYFNKLNASFSFGGAQLAIDTIEYNFKVKIDNYVLVDFEAFEKFIDLLGGLTIEGVTKSEAKYMRDVVKIKSVKAGTNTFNGWHTLWYCRIRYLDNDFKRTERQRKVISALISKITKTSPIKLAKIMEEILPMIQTDIPKNDLVSLGVGALLKYLHYDIAQHQVPASGTWWNETFSGAGDVLNMDRDENAELLKEFIYKQDKTEAESKE